MKRRLGFFALALVTALSLCTGGAAARAAEELWSEEYYRAFDTTGELSDAERDDLDAQCLSFVERFRLDLTMLSVGSEQLDGLDMDEFAEEYYRDYGFGYGAGRDGFLLLYNAETEDILLKPFGAAEDVFDADELARIEAFAARQRAEHRVWGVMYATYKWIADRVESAAPAEAAADENPGKERERPASEREGAAGMPAWYPADTERFEPFHDPDAPRVADDADIFTDAEEQRMEARLAALRAELDRDIVIYTDLSDYGLGHAVCAADFYDFNGYGCGDEYEGICLFICMEPDNRGWWACCTGPDTKALYTEEIANEIDDALYEYLADGAYAQGVSDWIENIATLYRKGSPFAPEWYPDRGAPFERFHSADAPRVRDEAGLLSAAEVDALTARAAELAGKYGVDVVLHTARYPSGIWVYDYLDTYYSYNGYGLGSGYDGITLTVFPGYGSLVSGYGAGAEKLSDVNRERLEDRCDSALDGGAYAAMSAWLDQTEHMLKTGRVPRSAASWGASGVLGAIIGAIFGGISLGGAKRSMKTVRSRWDADEYVAPGSLRVVPVRDDFLGTTTTRQYSPREKASSGGSSGGRSGGSSFSHSYSGSSGRSHSGSGRRF